MTMTDAEQFRAFRFALDPTNAQRQNLARHVGAAEAGRPGRSPLARATPPEQSSGAPTPRITASHEACGPSGAENGRLDRGSVSLRSDCMRPKRGREWSQMQSGAERARAGDADPPR